MKEGVHDAMLPVLSTLCVDRGNSHWGGVDTVKGECTCWAFQNGDFAFYSIKSNKRGRHCEGGSAQCNVAKLSLNFN